MNEGAKFFIQLLAYWAAMYCGHIEQDICFGIIKFSLAYIISMIIIGYIGEHFKRKEAKEFFEKISKEMAKEIKIPAKCHYDINAEIQKRNAENN